MLHTLTSAAESILQREFGVKNAVVRWDPPREKGRGDYTTTVALSLSKQLGKKPVEIAQVLADGLAKEKDMIESIEVAGPGYINVTLKPDVLLAMLVESKRAHAPVKTRTKDAPVIVEYSQPNIAKPLGVHHILSTVIGQSVSNLYRHLGYPTVAINHLGDWGTQFGKMSVAMKKWGTKPAKECSLADFLTLYVRFHEEAAKEGSTLEDEARDAFHRLEEGDKELRAFWKDVVAVTMQEIEQVYARLRISFDHVHGESFYEDKMAPILEEGKKKKVFTEGEKGALIAQFPEASGLPPAIVLKGDGSTIYHTRDLATIRYRIDTWHPQAIFYVVDVAQQLYFQQLFAMVAQLGWDLPHLEHLIIGRMSFADRSMSTRKGNILRLQEVLDEGVTRARAIIKERGDSIQTDNPEELAEMMGTGAIVYGIVSQNRKMDIVFDWDKMLSFEGNSAPYLQYTHARARSVLRKAEEQAVMPESVEIFTVKERSLVALLLQFPTILEEARATHMPHKIATFLHELCQEFNGFYNVEPILKAEGVQRQLRLALTDFTASVLKVGAELLTLRVPERM